MTTRAISGTSTMQEILTAYPAAQRALFRRYHIGGCSSCGFQPQDTLETVLRNHNCPDPIANVIQFLEDSQAHDDKTKMDVRALTGLIAAKTPVRVVDMRHPDEVAECGAIPGAIQLTQEVAQELQYQWPKNTKIVLYCQHGIRSADAAAYLAGHGFSDIWTLAGGFEAWLASGQPASA